MVRDEAIAIALAISQTFSNRICYDLAEFSNGAKSMSLTATQYKYI